VKQRVKKVWLTPSNASGWLVKVLFLETRITLKLFSATIVATSLCQATQVVGAENHAREQSGPSGARAAPASGRGRRNFRRELEERLSRACVFSSLCSAVAEPAPPIRAAGFATAMNYVRCLRRATSFLFDAW